MANISTGGKVKSGMTAAELRKIHFRIGKDFGLSDIPYNKNLSNYTKFIVVRHPLERLVSAYRDKMRGGDVTFLRRYVPGIIDMLRTNNTDTSMYPTFKEFVQMILANMPISSNPHWTTYFFRCDVCHVKYDYILKVETMEHDMKMFLSNVYFSGMKFITDHKLNSFKPTNDLFDNPYSKHLVEFEELSAEEIRALSSKFQHESDFYGYTFNQKTLYAECCDYLSSDYGSSNQGCCC